MHSLGVCVLFHAAFALADVSIVLSLGCYFARSRVILEKASPLKHACPVNVCIAECVAYVPAWQGPA